MNFALWSNNLLRFTDGCGVGDGGGGGLCVYMCVCVYVCVLNVYALISVWPLLSSKFVNNSGTALYLMDSFMTVDGEMLFERNVGVKGGAIALFGRSRVRKGTKENK